MWEGRRRSTFLFTFNQKLHQSVVQIGRWRRNTHRMRRHATEIIAIVFERESRFADHQNAHKKVIYSILNISRIVSVNWQLSFRFFATHMKLNASGNENAGTHLHSAHFAPEAINHLDRCCEATDIFCCVHLWKFLCFSFSNGYLFLPNDVRQRSSASKWFTTMAQRTVTSLQESRVYERACFDVEVMDFETSVYIIYRSVFVFVYTRPRVWVANVRKI